MDERAMIAIFKKLNDDVSLVFSVVYLGKNLFSPCGGNGGSEISLINCLADLNESAEIVSEGLTPNESGIMEPSTTYNLGYTFSYPKNYHS